MIVKATDIKNNFGKYLKLLDQEDIIVTRNGTPIAKITRHKDWDDTGMVHEQAAKYGYNEKKMSYEDFTVMSEEANERYEYIDGTAYLLASPGMTHQKVIGNLYASFRLWFDAKKCAPYLSPFDVTLKRGEHDVNVVQPDLVVICDPENRNEKDRYTGIPPLVVEVLSSESARMDLIKKLDLYMQTGIQEYWVVNHLNQEVIVYRFENRDIADMKLFVREDRVESLVFQGLSIELKEVFA